MLARVIERGGGFVQREVTTSVSIRGLLNLRQHADGLHPGFFPTRE